MSTVRETSGDGYNDDDDILLSFICFLPDHQAAKPVSMPFFPLPCPYAVAQCRSYACLLARYDALSLYHNAAEMY